LEITIYRHKKMHSSLCAGRTTKIKTLRQHSVLNAGYTLQVEHCKKIQLSVMLN